MNDAIKRLRNSEFILAEKIVLVLIALTLVARMYYPLLLLLEDGVLEWEELMLIPYAVACVVIISIVNKPPKSSLLVVAVCLCILDALNVADNILDYGFNIVYAIQILLNVLIVVTSLNYYLGYQHGSVRMVMYSVLIMGNIVFIGIIEVMKTMLSDPEIEWEDCVQQILSYAAWESTYLFFIILLLHPTIHEAGIGKRLKAGMVAVESEISIGSEAYVLQSEVDAMVGLDQSMWTTYEDGPIEREFSSTMVDGNRVYTFLSRQWRGEDCIRISLFNDTGSLSYGKGFKMTYYMLGTTSVGQMIRIYGEDGYFIQMFVKDMSHRVVDKLKRDNSREEYSETYVEMDEEVETLD
ncbi:MAG: hypothetical protein II933_01035 [Candidatus Methanomethylophilaceae archaeon]|nr:hypothetical protein [Candidatus Methanomethylophilaceae archaeon]